MKARKEREIKVLVQQAYLRVSSGGKVVTGCNKSRPGAGCWEEGLQEEHTVRSEMLWRIW